MLKNFIWICFKGRLPTYAFLSNINVSWLTDYRHSQRILAIIATRAWFIWTSRCNIIFKNHRPNHSLVVHKAFAHAREFDFWSSIPLGKNLIHNNFSSADDLFLFSHATVNNTTQGRSIGFFISNSRYLVCLAGCLSQSLMINSSDELFALEVAL